MDIVVTAVARHCQAKFKKVEVIVVRIRTKVMWLLIEETRRCKDDLLMEVRFVRGALQDFAAAVERSNMSVGNN